jgi:hypothetical protein
VPNSPADKAGIRANDIILEFAGKPAAENPEEFTRQVNDVKAGEKVDIVVLRKGKKVELKGVEVPAAREIPRPGLPNPLFPDGDEQPFPLPGFKPLPLKALPGFPNPLDAGRLELEPNGRANFTSVSDMNGQVTIKARQDGVGYVITGTRGDDGVAVEKVTITDGDKKPVEVNNLKDVPKEYEATVQKLIESTSKPRPRKRD